MKILLTGASGQLGQCIIKNFPSDWSLFAYDSKELDITNPEQIESIIAKVLPDVIINAAAYTAVDKAEDDIESAFAINETGVSYLAEASKKQGAKLIHISTDYVFDGSSSIPYREEDETNPQSIYGKSKLAGEQALANILEDFIIIRTAWVFSEFGQNFYLTMRRLFSDRESLNIVGDQIGNPTYAGDLAKAIIAAIKKDIPTGIYHYSGNISVSWYEFASFILESTANSLNHKVTLSAITSSEYPQKAKRPSFSQLSNEKLAKLGIAPSNWQAAVKLLSQKV